MRFKKYLLISVTLLAACEPFSHSRGNVTAEGQFRSFIIGQTTMEDVLRKCGTPSLHKNNFTWIYTGGVSEETSFKGIEIKDRAIIRLSFDANKVLKNKELIRPSNNVYHFDEDTTDLMSNQEVENLLKKSND